MSTHVYTFLGQLHARTDLLPGAGRGAGDPHRPSSPSDLPLRRNAAGNPMIPGTALAGVLRGLATRVAPGLGFAPCVAIQSRPASEPCPCKVCELFGQIQPNEDNDQGGRASQLMFSHAPALLAAGASLSVRDGVGIQRDTGAAAADAAAKFDYELIPQGTGFDLRIEWEQHPDTDNGELTRLLAACLAEWQAGRAWIGAGSARGLGAFALTALEVSDRDLSDANQLMAFLRADAPWTQEPKQHDWLKQHLAAAKALARSHRRPRSSAASDTDAAGEPRFDKGADFDAETAPIASGGPQSRRQLPPAPSDGLVDDAALSHFADLRLSLRMPPPFLFHDAMQAALSGYDHAPLLHIDDADKHIVLPGAGLRGVLRAQCERIARTLATRQTGSMDAFAKQCPACDPNTHARPKAGENHHAPPSCATLAEDLLRDDPQRKEQVHETCLACQLFGSTRFGSRLRVEGGSARLPDQDALRSRDFLAIDRFTGGAKPGAKFDAQVPVQSADIEVRLFLENPKPDELGWLYLALRDLHDGLASLGFGAAKGFGRVQITGGELRLGQMPGVETGLGSELPPDRDLSAASLFEIARLTLDAQTLTDASRRDTVQAWIDAFNKRVQCFERTDGFVLEADSWFEHDAGQTPTLRQLYDTEAPAA